MAYRRGTTLPGALPSLEASNQAQIEDLVQRNRTLEHKNTKLSEQLVQETARAKEAVLEIQRQWDLNQSQWKEGCEDIIASYRIVQKQIEVELERERTAVIKEMKITREEKLQRLKRDYKIKLFQMKEEELERRIEELATDKALRLDGVEDALVHERENTSALSVKLKETKEALARIMKDKEEKEDTYNKLIEEHSNLEASTATLDTKYQRTQLKLEGTRTKIADLERHNEELKRLNVDLTNQLERWENLETKGGEAKEKEHKRRIALELELNELKEKYAAQTEELEKAKKKTERMKDVTANYEAEVTEQKDLVAEANRQIAKLQKQADKLKADLEVERARVPPLSPQKRKERSPPPPDFDMELSKDSNDKEDSPPPKPKSSTIKPIKAGPSTISTNVPSKSPVQTARKSTYKPPKRPKKPPPPNDSEIEELSDTEDTAPPPKKDKGKGKAKDTDVDEDEIREVPAPRKKAKRKASVEEIESSDDEVQSVEPPKQAAKKGSKGRSEQREMSVAKKHPSKPRGGSRAPSSSKQPNVEIIEIPQDEPKKKKRKLLFPGANAPGPFAFDTLGQFEDNALNIPTILSPVKPGEHVPQRLSTFKPRGRK